MRKFNHMVLLRFYICSEVFLYWGHRLFVHIGCVAKSEFLSSWLWRIMMHFYGKYSESAKAKLIKLVITPEMWVTSIDKSDSYKFRVSWTCWALMGNTAITIYLEKGWVKTTDNNRFFFPFYFQLLSFSSSIITLMVFLR